MITCQVVRDPNKIPIDCPECPVGHDGVMMRQTLSRLEEGMGHQGYRCDVCGHTIKYVPEHR